MSAQTLYRFWRAGDLLYVGISINAYRRASQHRHRAAWWEEADRVTFESHPTREAVQVAEARAIRAEKPKYNIMHNTSTEPVAVAPVVLPSGRRRLLKPEDVAARMGVAVQTIYRWRSDGTDMPKGFKVGNLVRWREETVDAWIAAREEKVAA